VGDYHHRLERVATTSIRFHCQISPSDVMLERPSLGLEAKNGVLLTLFCQLALLRSIGWTLEVNAVAVGIGERYYP
jgi:hypothetical protein